MFPYIEKSLALDEMEGITRTPREEVYKKVMEDFDYAIEKLPVQWPSDKYGRITKGARLCNEKHVPPCIMPIGKLRQKRPKLLSTQINTNCSMLKVQAVMPNCSGKAKKLVVKPF